MKMRKTGYTLLRRIIIQTMALLLLVGINSCEKEDYDDNEQTKRNEKFFAYNGQVSVVEDLIDFLRMKNDSIPFVEKFTKQYGYPMWKDMVSIYKSPQTILLIPIINKKQEEIETIWVFKIFSGKVEYYPVSKINVSLSDKWTFDYFTQQTLKRKPKSKLRFEIEEQDGMQTRMWVDATKCIPTFAGVEYNGSMIEVFTGWHCWESAIFIDARTPLAEIEEWGLVFPSDWWDRHNNSGNTSSGSTMPGIISDQSLNSPEYKNVKDVFDCIVTNASSEFVKNMLNRFYGSDAEFDITYKVGEMPSEHKNALGLCEFSEPDSVTREYKRGVITFNKNELNTSSLELITTLLHETMHAYIHSYLYSKDPSLKATTLDEAFNLYKETLEKGATVDQEHNFMAANWVQTMAEELQRFHATQKTYFKFWNYVDISEEADRRLFYEGMAWSGLEKTKAYKELSLEYTRKMNAIYNNENKRTVSKIWLCP